MDLNIGHNMFRIPSFAYIKMTEFINFLHFYLLNNAQVTDP